MTDNRLVLLVLVVAAFLLFNNLGSYSGAASITRGYETSGFGEITPVKGYSAAYAPNIRSASEENDICAAFGLTYKNCINRGTNTKTCRELFYYYKNKYNC